MKSRHFLLACIGLVVAGCASRHSDGETFFTLPAVEGRVSAVSSINWGIYPVAVRIEVTSPKKYKGEFLWLRFKSLDDEGYRILIQQDPGSLIRANSNDGRGIITNGEIVLVSDASPRITLLEGSPNQPIQHNAGSRPSSGVSPASETPSASAPRG
jgi:hypothetical protein